MEWRNIAWISRKINKRITMSVSCLLWTGSLLCKASNNTVLDRITINEDAVLFLIEIFKR